jgi:IS30 family transposase
VAGKPVSFQLIGYEIEEEATWCYLEAASFPGTGAVEIHNRLLYDYLPEQTNLVHYYRDGQRSSYKLVNPEETAKL